MNEAKTVPAEAATIPRKPRWGLIGIVAAATIVVVLGGILGVRLLLSTPHPTLGVTAAAELQPGSCLAEGAVDLDEYTVVECSSPHPQQVVAAIDLSIDMPIYSQFSAVTTYTQEVCNRFIEYGLYVRPEVKASEFELIAIAVPSEEQYAAGGTSALCSITSLNGAALTTDLYQPLP